jgi:hypothetical protein
LADHQHIIEYPSVFFVCLFLRSRYGVSPLVMRQRVEAMDRHDAGGAFSSSTDIRAANEEKLKTLLNRASARAAAATTKRHPALTGDYLDFDNPEFGGKWVNVAWAALVVLALLLFYVLWFTDWVR